MFEILLFSLKTTTTLRPPANTCREVIPGRLQVKWEIQDDKLVVELFGRMKENYYMAFGLSGAHGRTQMVGGDVAVAFYDTQARVFRAEDYYLSNLSQCDSKGGVCPDGRIGGRNDVEFCKLLVKKFHFLQISQIFAFLYEF